MIYTQVTIIVYHTHLFKSRKDVYFYVDKTY
uniref:Uncharacterized protein n=1 Tax=Siphoviridae sp. ctxyw6 TaxID=2825742 RepID=A0A8S5TZE7_9CAUD|nr:MAG TPA: hypothetical protein [Siphoviridae sp. ctxyw6]